MVAGIAEALRPPAELGVELLADLPVASSGGVFLLLVKTVFMLLLIAPWLYLAPQVHKDVVRVRGPQTAWNVVVLTAGTAGVLTWLLVPFYLAGMMIYLVLTGSVLGAYVVYRNGRVQAHQKILTADHVSAMLGRRDREALQVVTRLKLYDCDNKIALPPDARTATTEQCHAYNVAQQLLYDIVWRRASEADLSPAWNKTRVRFVVDGVLVERAALNPTDSEAAIQHLKPLAGMDAEDRRRPQKGKISVDMVDGAPVDMLLTTAGTTGGQRLQFQIIQESIQTRLDGLGMSSDVLQQVKEMNGAGSGLLIVSGRPGSGVTSTLYSLLREQDAFTQQLVAVESAPVIDLENITQNAYGEAANLSETLTRVLRRDPDVVMVDRCEDSETANLICRTAENKTVLLGMPAGDTFLALAKWVEVCGDAGAAVAPLRGAICQMLLRKLCPKCREGYRPDPQLLAKLNLSGKGIDKFYRPRTHLLTDENGQPITCPTCQGSGYFGRTAVFELLEVADEIRQLVTSGADVAQIKAACRKKKMLYLQEQALRKVIAGVTSIHEVVRVSQQARKQ